MEGEIFLEKAMMVCQFNHSQNPVKVYLVIWIGVSDKVSQALDGMGNRKNIVAPNRADGCLLRVGC